MKEIILPDAYGDTIIRYYDEPNYFAIRLFNEVVELSEIEARKLVAFIMENIGSKKNE